MYELRNILYMESIRDQIPAYQLDIQDYKNEVSFISTRPLSSSNTVE